MRTALVGMVLVLALGLGGCATRPDRSPVPPPTSTQTPTLPGITLRQLGFENGPTALALPPGTVLDRGVDQPNVVTVLFTTPGPDAALAHLRGALPAAGFRVTADAGGSLVFDGDEWTGSYTATGDLSALTLRRRA